MITQVKDAKCIPAWKTMMWYAFGKKPVSSYTIRWVTSSESEFQLYRILNGIKMDNVIGTPF